MKRLFEMNDGFPKRKSLDFDLREFMRKSFWKRNGV